MSALLRSELLKVTTTKTIYWLFVLSVALAAIMTALFTLIQVLSNADGLGTFESTRAVLGSLGTQAGVHIIMICVGVLAIGTEFRYNTITPTLLSSPRRGRVVVAKALVVVGTAIVYSLAAIGIALAVYLIWMRIRGVDVALGNTELWRLLGGTGASWVLYAAMGMGIGALIRNQIVALIVAIVYAWILDPLLALGLNAVAFLRDAGVPGYLPGQAASGLQLAPEAAATGPEAGDVPAFLQIDLLSQLPAGLVLLGWALLFFILGTRLALARDIS